MNFLRAGLSLLKNKNRNNNSNSNDQVSDEDRAEMERRAKEGKSSFSPFNKTFKAVGSKALINFLLGNPVVIIFVAILAAIIGFILLIVILTGSKGLNTPISSTLSKTLSSHTSVNITIVKDEDSEDNVTTSMSLEDYVKKALMYYAGNMKVEGEDGYNAFYAIAVSLRTEAVRNNYNVTFYGDLNSASSQTEAVENAVKHSEGIVLAEEGYDVNSNDSIPYIKTNNTFFNWDSVTTEGYHVLDHDGFDIDSDFVSEYVTNSMYVNCPANYTGGYVDGEYPDECWEEKEVEKDVTNADGTTTTETETEYYWKHQESSATPSFSIVGALYLSKEYGYSYSTLLKNFYGDNYIFIKGEVSKSGSNSTSTAVNSCSNFDLHNTTLTEEEFISGATQELERRLATEKDKYGIRKYLLEGDHLSQMYNQSLQNNLNPEFSFAKAIAENSPGGAKHNYWGVGCYNGEGCARAVSYTPGQEFAEYAQYINRVYKDFNDILMRYQQIGNYWWNPGDSDDGGCYYASSIYGKVESEWPEHVQRGCGSGAPKCSEGNLSNCVKTTDEDQYLYGLYVLRVIFNIRKTAFGIDSNSDSCSNTTCSDVKVEQRGTCSLFRQFVGNGVCWTDDTLGNGPGKIGNSGCTLTSIAIAMSCSGKVSSSNFSPATLNNALKQDVNGSNAFSGDAIIWGNLNNYLSKLAPGFGYVNTTTYASGDSLEQARTDIINAFNNGTYEHIMLVASLRSKQHWVLIPYAPSETDTEVTVYDPEKGETKMALTSFRNLEIFGWND